MLRGDSDGELEALKSKLLLTRELLGKKIRVIGSVVHLRDHKLSARA